MVSALRHTVNLAPICHQMPDRTPWALRSPVPAAGRSCAETSAGPENRLLLDQLTADLAGAVQLGVDIEVPQAIHQMLGLLRTDLGRASELADGLAGVVDVDRDVARLAVARGPVNVNRRDCAGERVIFDDPGDLVTQAISLLSVSRVT
jgi:hypothetical protein